MSACERTVPDEHLAGVGTSACIRTLEGNFVAYGIVEAMTGDDALMAITPASPRIGTIYRILLVSEKNPSRRVERFGEVVWTRDAFNAEKWVADCRVRWVTVGESEDAASATSLA